MMQGTFNRGKTQSAWWLAVVCLAVGLAARADLLTWTGLVDDDWFTAGNWDPGRVPADGDTVAIAAGTVRLTNSSASLVALTLDASSTLTVYGWSNALQAKTLSIAGMITHAANHVTVTNAAGDWTPLHRIWLKGSNLTVAAGGVLNADDLGYPPEAGPGAGSGSGGAAHAGVGRRGFGGGVVASAYGDPAEPWQPGSGGGASVNSGPGGGSIRIEATGQLMVEGEIRARGRNASGTHGRGASGGSIWISCHTMGGTSNGLVNVAGGSGNYYGAGASAGRIALHYDPDAQALLAEPRPPVRFAAPGGARGPQAASEWLLPSMGTLYLPDTLLINGSLDGKRFDHTRLVIPDLTEWNPASLLIEDCVLGLPRGLHLVVTGDLILTHNAALHLFATPVADPRVEAGSLIEVGGDLRMLSGSWLHRYADDTIAALVDFVVNGDLQISEGGGIDADYKGYTFGHGPGSPVGRGGGAYGGHGGQGYGNHVGGLAYGETHGPIEAGSGGGAVPSVAGQGGGGVRITVTGKAVVNGLISARGAPGVANHGPGGSGGGIELTCRTLEGAATGLLRVDGGRGSFYGGSGGGGRIALVYDVDAQAVLRTLPAVRFSAHADPDTTHYGFNYKAEMGTLALPNILLLSPSPDAPIQLEGQRFWHTRLMAPAWSNWGPTALTVENCVIGFIDGFHLNVAGDLTLGVGSGLHLQAAANSAWYGARLDVGGNVSVASNGWLYPHADGVQGSIVGIFVNGDVTIAAGGGIDADGKGWFPVSDNSQGPGTGQNSGSGGGYGGIGGGTSGGAVYGKAVIPFEPGSPAGWRGIISGKGGGAIHLRVGGDVRIDGCLSADGYPGDYYYGPGGSGGAIFLVCHRIRGSGTLRARGMPGNNDRASGGGGRIAVWLHISPRAAMERIETGNLNNLVHYYPHSYFTGELNVDTLGNSIDGPAEAGSKGFYTVRGTLVQMR